MLAEKKICRRRLNKERTAALFQEASAQLAEVLTTTQQTTENIMDIVERCMDGQARAASMLTSLRERSDIPEVPYISAILDDIAALNHSVGLDLSTIITTLSFQDITGQRIKKAVEALVKIEGIVTGREQTSHNGATLREADARETALQTEAGRATVPCASELKGPTKDASQAHVDRLLAQLGKD